MLKSVLRIALATIRALILMLLVALIIPVLLMASWIPGFGPLVAAPESVACGYT